MAENEITITPAGKQVDIFAEYAQLRADIRKMLERAEGIESQIEGMRDSSILSAENAKNAKNLAVQKADEIKGYVIPTSATYSPDVIDQNIKNHTLSNMNYRHTSTNSTTEWKDMCEVDGTFHIELFSGENGFAQPFSLFGISGRNTLFVEMPIDALHTHSKDIEFRITEENGNKKIQFKNIVYRTTRAIYIYRAQGVLAWL